MESGFSNKDGPAKCALPKNTISTWIKIKVHYIDALEHSSYKRKNQRRRLWMSRARIFWMNIAFDGVKGKTWEYIKELCFEWGPSFKLVVALMERKVSYVLEKCTFFLKKNCCNISNAFLDPVEQETFRALAYHHHLQNLQLQQVFNSWS